MKVLAGITLVVAATDEEARAKQQDLLRYGNREGALALFGGWPGVDMSNFEEDEDFRFVKEPAARSVIDRWNGTVPGSKNLAWNKDHIAEHLLLGGMATKIVGGPQTSVDELEM